MRTPEQSVLLKARQACNITQWYNDFIEDTIYTEFIEIPYEIVQYLKEDQIILPIECYNSPSDWCDADEDMPTFPEFSKKIQLLLKKFENNAFIKMNWHAPTDSTWISPGNTMRVRELKDVYLMIKASGILNDDLHNSISDVKPVLAVKTWLDIHPADEFRCIVVNNILRGITQRDWPQYYPHYEAEKLKIVCDMILWYTTHIKGKFPLENYVYDVIRIGGNTSKITLVDFSPLNENTNLYCFEWPEIEKEMKKEENHDHPPVFRFLNADIGVVPRQKGKFPVPIDLQEHLVNASKLN